MQSLRVIALMCGAIVMSMATVAANAGQTIEIMFEDAAPPWSRADGTGIANDVVAAAFREMGVTVWQTVVPYVRCKKSVLTGKIPACVSMTWLPEFEGYVKLASTPPLIVLNVDVFENVDAPLPRPPGKGCRLPPGSVVGVVRGYEYPSETRALTEAGVKFENGNNDTQNLIKLAAGRVDAGIVVTNNIETTNRKAIEAKVENKVRFAFNCGHETGTIGFSTRHPKGAWAQAIYETGYKRISDNGVLARINAEWTRRLAAK